MDADRPDSKIGSRYSISCFAARTSLYKPWAQVSGPSLHRLDFRFPFLRSDFFTSLYIPQLSYLSMDSLVKEHGIISVEKTP